MIEEVKSLYEKYVEELKGVRQIQRSRVRNLNPHFDDIESELLYMFIREYSPEHLIEFSPLGGWSTSWILEAMNKNEKGKCVSYDLHDTSEKNLSLFDSLDKSRWSFVEGDVQEQYSSFDYASIDFIFIDSDHSTPFATRYVNEVLVPAKAEYEHNVRKFHRKGKQIPVFVHDVYGNFASSKEEGKVVRDFLSDNNIDFVTPSKNVTSTRVVIDEIRANLGLSDLKLHNSDMNPVVIFKLG